MFPLLDDFVRFTRDLEPKNRLSSLGQGAVFTIELCFYSFLSTVRHISKYVLVAAASLPHILFAGPVLQPTPPMGFNNWAAFMCGLNESLFVETAEAMVGNGMLAAGYDRLNLDDCWSLSSRAANGSMQWDPEKFPRGFPWLTSNLKSLGFNTGIYTDSGTQSCAGYPGALGYEELDAHTFASWGFDFLKLDGCNMPLSTEEEYKSVYGHWHDILHQMPNPLIFSESAPAYFAEAENLTDWYSVMGWVPKFGQLARHSRDTLVFNSTLYWPEITGWDSIMFNYGQEVRLARYQCPGYFNDPDFLNADHFDLSLDEKKSHFALWASFSAPLIISAWIPGLSSEEIEYLTNKDLIDVDQDSLALQATLVSQDGTWDVLTKSLANGDRLLTMVNRGKQTASHSVSFQRTGILASTTRIRVRDLWTGSFGSASGKVTALDVPPHGTAVFRLSSEAGPLHIIPTGMIFNTASLKCLTSSPEGASWANCSGEDTQVWQTKSDGSISSLTRLSDCLTNLGSGKIGLVPCGRKLDERWDYHITGNVQSRSSKECLTESDHGSVTISECQNGANGQVFALPSGVRVVQDTRYSALIYAQMARFWDKFFNQIAII